MKHWHTMPTEGKIVAATLLLVVVAYLAVVGLLIVDVIR